ncbi:MAG: hypothetical protein N3D79_06485, partial [Acidilobaceae archaeon]|nr:hypothetical protein [Acidilobaceae archaeon]
PPRLPPSLGGLPAWRARGRGLVSWPSTIEQKIIKGELPAQQLEARSWRLTRSWPRWKSYRIKQVKY